MNSYEDVSKLLAYRVQEIREMRRMSKKALARAAGVTPSAIAHIERGRRVPSVDLLCRIATALDVPIISLFAGNVPSS